MDKGSAYLYFPLFRTLLGIIKYREQRGSSNISTYQVYGEYSDSPDSRPGYFPHYLVEDL